VHVPLILRGPGVAPGHHAAPTSTAGLYGTLAALAGIPVEGALTLESATPVAELTAVHGVKPTLPDRDASGAFIPNRRRFTAIYQDHWKFVRSTADGRELYDLARDPGETANLAAAEPERVAAMEAAMDAWILATPRAPDGPLPQAERKRRKAARVKRTGDEAGELAALGYVE
jgi:arylsulfatase A-like enzyme